MAQSLETGLVVNGLTGDTNALRVINSLNVDSFIVDINGNVGIGVLTPTTDLEVSGKTKTQTLQVTSGATSGHVLTLIDLLGNTQWQVPVNANALSVSVNSPISATTGGNTILGIIDAKADGSTKGAASFNSSDFNDNGSGLISIDYTNAQSASSSNNGFLTPTDWNTFNNKQNTITLTTTGTTGVATLSATTSTGSTLNIPVYGGSGSGFGYSIMLGNGPTASLISGTTYAFGSTFVLQAQPLSADRPSRRTKTFKSGQVTFAVIVTQLSGNVFATPANVANMQISVYNLTTSASSIIDSSFPISGGSSWDNVSSLPSRNVFYTLASPLSVSYNDEIQIRMTGNWTGAPSAISHTVFLHIL